MKTIGKITVVLLMLAVSATSAQESVELFSVPLSDPGSKGKLELHQIRGSITVTAYDGQEVVVKASMDARKSKNGKTANGMTRIGNSSLAISAEEHDNTVQIINEQHNRKTDMEIKVPANFDLQLRTINDGDIFVEGVNGEMEISNTNGKITLENVSGSASADTTNGDVKVDFNSVTAGTSMAFSSFNGDIDIRFPSSLKADIKLRSDMGEIFTDFEMAMDSGRTVVKKSQPGGTNRIELEQWVKGKINGGGPEILFKTWNGDILIRSN